MFFIQFWGNITSLSIFISPPTYMSRLLYMSRLPCIYNVYVKVISIRVLVSEYDFRVNIELENYVTVLFGFHGITKFLRLFYEKDIIYEMWGLIVLTFCKELKLYSRNELHKGSWV